MLRPHCENKSEEFDEKTNAITDSSSTEDPVDNLDEPVNVFTSPESPISSFEAEEEANSQLTGTPSNQIALYESKTDYPQELEPVKTRHSSRTSLQSKVFPSVGAFTVQCATCFKWRIIPMKQKYEEIREHILEKPFFCETAREWKPKISCDDPTDIEQDGTRVWAIDRPNIAQPPPGWQRLLHIRGEGCTRFADVYYQAPSGKKLRSMVEIQKFLMDNPGYSREGVTPSRFSFQIPRPLRQNYIRKRPARLIASLDNAITSEPADVTPLSWIEPEDPVELNLDMPGLAPLNAETAFNPPSKKPRQQTQTQIQSPNPHHNGDPSYVVEDPDQSRTASFSGH